VNIAKWHEVILQKALEWRDSHPNFRFNLRKNDYRDTNRLANRYWFTGNDGYLFFAPFRRGDSNNKTNTVGFVINFDDDGNPRACNLEIVFGAEKDPKFRSVYRKIVSENGPFKEIKKDKFKRKYDSLDPTIAFGEFLNKDMPKLDSLISSAGLKPEFEVSEASFKAMLDRVIDARRKLEVPAVGQVSPSTRSLCLLGTWGDENDPNLETVRKSIASNGAWASWWSFPISDRFRGELLKPFDLYLNTGRKQLRFRMRVDRMSTSQGEVGIVSPWPEITDSIHIGKTRAGDKKSQIFKTWLYVTQVEALDPPLSLDDFDPAEGVPVTAMLNQNAFGFAYRVTDNPNQSGSSMTSLARNLILYGPPGTGKTHKLRKLFDSYTDKPTSVDADAWLQEKLASYGWRSVIAAGLADIGRAARVPEIREHPWVRAKAKERGRTQSSIQHTIWGYLQEHTPESNVHVKSVARRPPFIFSKRESGEWEILGDWQEQDEESVELMRIIRAGPQGNTDKILRYKVVTFHPSFSYEDFVRGIRPVARSEEGTTEFLLVDGKFKQICDEAHANPEKRYAFFIDEINRANIAKVFGELITLIEPDKRAAFDTQGRLIRGMAVQLPGGDHAGASERPFGVPENLDIYGTMNTADRSIALLDIALRRRFEFEECEPDYNELRTSVEGVEIDRLVRQINDRLEFLLDRDHRIGHAFVMHDKSLSELSNSFSKKIIPLLQEYFFDDFSRVAMVLSTTGNPRFLREEMLNGRALFRGQYFDRDALERKRFILTRKETWTVETFKGIYEPARPTVVASEGETAGPL
jgi:hypothetical protein